MSKKHRFPRLKINQEISVSEKLLRHTYNYIIRSRNKHWNRTYDIYKTLKFGNFARNNFLVLSTILQEKQIDPAIYVKVLSRYGRFENSKYLPPPSWLASSKGLETFEWLKKKQRNHYELKADWKRSFIDTSEEEILEGVKSSTKMVVGIKKDLSLLTSEAIVFLWSELSPYFLGLVNTKMGINLEPGKDIERCQRFFIKRRNKHLWKKCYKYVNKNLSVS